MEVMFMNLEMLGQLIDTPRENGDLYLWRTGICFMHAGIRNDFPFLLYCE